MKRVLLVWALVVAVVGGASALIKAGGVETVAAGATLAQAADRSAATSFRYELLMTINAADLQVESVPLIHGEHAGARDHGIVDMKALFDAIPDTPPELSGVDLTIESIADGSTVYLRAPFFATLASLSPADAEVFGGLATLGDQWGRIDLAAFEDLDSAEVMSAAANQNVDPRLLFDVVRQAADVETLGGDTIRGVAAQGYRARVPMADLMRASGGDPDALAAQIGEDADAFLDLSLPLELWVDETGFVRRFVVRFDEELAEQLDVDPDELGEFNFSATMDLFDYGDPSIVIELPADAIDVTEDFRRLLELGG